MHVKPWGLARFVDVPSADLRDRWVPAQAVWPGFLDRPVRPGSAAPTGHPVQVPRRRDPKRLARIYRFARLILSVDATRPVDWSGLAHAAGYYDQAHFSREFKDFTGHTPTAYLSRRRRFPARPGFPPDSGPMPAE